MFINKSSNGKNNLCGETVMLLRKKMGLSQRGLAERLQLVGMDFDKNAIQRIECGKRFVTDIELLALSKVLSVSLAELLKDSTIE
ncbi:MAG: helix-turn-helix transcriptional regulator [Oscillospiraceae bacterium]|nr:helix-turn-helix transcriptional regulator [Oscillospiraceae bacterium]